jgi:hypothetical protein
MAANTVPIFSKAPLIGLSDATPILTANTTTDLTAGTIYLLFTADATNGSYVDKVILQALGTNTASVARLWINNGATTATATNNTQFKDKTMAATTVSQVAEVGTTEITVGFALPAGYRIYMTLGTTVAAGFKSTVVAGQY